MPDTPHEARHRAVPRETSRHHAPGRHAAPSRRRPTPKPSRLIAGLALPTAATVALMFGAAGAAVATQAKVQKTDPGQVATAKTEQEPTAGSVAGQAGKATAPKAQALGSAYLANPAPGDDATPRETAVARGLERKQIAAAAQVAKRAFAHSWRLPITNPVKTSGFGYRWGRLHAGEDFAVDVGTPLASMSSGTVAYAGEESGFGNLVEIRYWDGTISYFAHMSVVSVNVGESVDPGQIVGESGNTGHSTGPHLHLEIHPDGGEAVNPLPWLSSHHIES